MTQTGAVTLIQRFGGALNLNVHFHMIFLDGVYIDGSNGHPVWFRHVKAPTRAELTRLAHAIAQRVGRYLERHGLIERDTPVSTKRLTMTRKGRVRYELKTPWRNGTTHVIFEALDFMFRTNGMPRAQEAQVQPFPDWIPGCQNPESTLSAFTVYLHPIASIGQR